MTGAMLPAGTDRVAPQERCRVTACGIGAPHIEPGANVRRCGEDVQEGNLLVAGGTRLDPRHIALLAATGHSIIPCRDRLRVALVATGDEVVRGTPDRSRGQVRDSNTPMLAALLSTARDFDVAEF